MSALATKRQMEQMAGLAQDTSGMSGADLAQAVMLNQSNVPTPSVMPDGARLDQMDWKGAKDDFTGVNGTNLNSRNLKNGRSWSVDSNGTNFAITGNACVYDGVAERFAMVDTGLLDNFAVRVKQSAITGNGMRIVLRGDAVGTTCCYVMRDQTANTWSLVNRTGSVVASSFNDAVDLVAGDVIECQVKGDNVSVLVNGVVRGVLTGMSALYPNGSRQGFDGVATNGFTADDFYAFQLSS